MMKYPGREDPDGAILRVFKASAMAARIRVKTNHPFWMRFWVMISSSFHHLRT
jgi:hypothetical protein